MDAQTGCSLSRIVVTKNTKLMDAQTDPAGFGGQQRVLTTDLASQARHK
jgi:hypothetical protein